MSRAAAPSPSRRFTFRGNLRTTRHGWLRLTPAYSVHLVRELLESYRTTKLPVLDPFCGTGTTALACVEAGIDAVTVELNPFLSWLARVKTTAFDAATLEAASETVDRMARAATARAPRSPKVPAIHRIERWWAPQTLAALGRAKECLDEAPAPDLARDLATLAFCRTLIDVASVSFGHQSMSFRDDAPAPRPKEVALTLSRSFAAIAESARTSPGRGRVQIVSGDSRRVDTVLQRARVGAVITSPPYPNRMSYIRELRPYMYWLGYLRERSDAGNLDWDAIGGTWGAATSRLSTWTPDPRVAMPDGRLRGLVARIARQSVVLARYVERYFEDMSTHIHAVSRVMAPGAHAHYVVGNTKFYDVVVPVEELYAALLESAGLTGATIEVLRKRTSKQELFEFLVTARKPSRADARRKPGSARSRGEAMAE